MQRMIKHATWIFRACILVSILTQDPGRAQTNEADSTAPVTIGGFVDTYFSWNFGRPASRTNRLTNFDLAESQFVLSSAET